MKKELVFDMDGTLADLYNFDGWLDRLENKRPVFKSLNSLVKMEDFIKCLEILKDEYTLKVVSWLPMNADEDYKKVCRKDKIDWLAMFGIKMDKIHLVKYGTPKHLIKGISKTAILFDDNKEVRDKWKKSNRVAFCEKDMMFILKIMSKKVVKNV